MLALGECGSIGVLVPDDWAREYPDLAEYADGERTIGGLVGRLDPGVDHCRSRRVLPSSICTWRDLVLSKGDVDEFIAAVGTSGICEMSARDVEEDIACGWGWG
jgi:hypothetical protein